MKPLLTFLFIFYAASCLAQPSKADTQTDGPGCTNITVSPQLDDCVREKMKASNAHLLDEFVKFEQRTKRVYAADLKLGNELIEKVRKAQDAWTMFRDLNCHVSAFEIEEKTPAYITTVNNCIVRMNAERIEEIKKLMR